VLEMIATWKLPLRAQLAVIERIFRQVGHGPHADPGSAWNPMFLADLIKWGRDHQF